MLETNLLASVSIYSFVLGGFILIYFYLRSTRNYNYWKSKGVKGPKPWPFFGNVIDVMFNPIVSLDMVGAQKYGRIYGIFEGSKPQLIIAEPELIKQITVKNFNFFDHRQGFKGIIPYVDKMMGFAKAEPWRRIRSIIGPTFTSLKMRQMSKQMDQCVDVLLDDMKSSTKNKQDIDVKTIFGAYTIDVIANCCFTIKTNAIKDPNDMFVKNAKEFFNSSVLRFLVFFFLPKRVSDLLNSNPISRNSPQFLAEMTKHLIKQRRESKEKHNDFLQLLMNAGDNNTLDEDDKKEKNGDEDERHHSLQGDEETDANKRVSQVTKKLDDDEIIAQSIYFLAVGYETTGTLMSFCAYALALNQNIQEKLYKAIKESVDANNGQIDYDTVTKLEYLDAVISETLRVYPPEIRLERQANSDYKLGNTGIIIEKDMVLYIPIYAIHHDPEFFPQPEKFQPERFLPENRDKVIPYSYLPFGSGPRNCIGMRFALLGAKLALARILLQFKFIKSPNTKVPLDFLNRRPLLQAENIIVGVEMR